MQRPVLAVAGLAVAGVLLFLPLRGEDSDSDLDRLESQMADVCERGGGILDRHESPLGPGYLRLLARDHGERFSEQLAQDHATMTLIGCEAAGPLARHFEFHSRADALRAARAYEGTGTCVLGSALMDLRGATFCGELGGTAVPSQPKPGHTEKLTVGLPAGVIALIKEDIHDVTGAGCRVIIASKGPDEPTRCQVRFAEETRIFSRKAGSWIEE